MQFCFAKYNSRTTNFLMLLLSDPLLHHFSPSLPSTYLETSPSGPMTPPRPLFSFFAIKFLIVFGFVLLLGFVFLLVGLLSLSGVSSSVQNITEARGGSERWSGIDAPAAASAQ